MRPVTSVATMVTGLEASIVCCSVSVCVRVCCGLLNVLWFCVTLEASFLEVISGNPMPHFAEQLLSALPAQIIVCICACVHAKFFSMLYPVC